MNQAAVDSLAMVGALARIDVPRRASIIAALQIIPGVEPFELGEAERIGLVLEGSSIESVHDLLQGPVRATDGVLGVWPISLEVDDDPDRVVQPGETR